MRLVHRPMLPADRSFVVESWISSYRQMRGILSFHRWHDAMADEIADILARPDMRVLVAADADTTDHVADLFGWLAYMPQPSGPPLVFYCYVKFAFRKNGIAGGLFNAARIDPRSRFPFVCLTSIVGTLQAAGKIPNARRRPLLGRFPNERSANGESRSEADSDAA